VTQTEEKQRHLTIVLLKLVKTSMLHDHVHAAFTIITAVSHPKLFSVLTKTPKLAVLLSRETIEYNLFISDSVERSFGSFDMNRVS
jgi:hypothetical protein